MYQTPHICRFFVNILEFLSVTGMQSYPNKYYTLPVDTTNTFRSGELGQIDYAHFDATSNGFIAVLGHNLNDYGQGINLLGTTSTGIINYGAEPYNETVWLSPQYNGFTIASFVGLPGGLDFFQTAESFNIGSMVIGQYYDLTADLSLTMTREMDGVKRTRTKGGTDLVDYNYTKAPLWGNAAPWELYSGTPHSNQKLARVGRRTWNLNFSYLQQKDIWPDVASINAYESYNSDGLSYESDVGVDGNLLLDDQDSLYSQVIHKVQNRPFIFQPDTRELEFAICKFSDMKKFSFQQQAPNLYRISLKIREVW